jgi:hypothetical protein
LKCEICDKKLRADNTIGVCRAHRHLSQATKGRIDLWKEQNRAHLAAYKKQYANNNRERMNQLCIDRRRKNPVARLAHAIRTRTNRVLFGRKMKWQNPVMFLGCSLTEARQHIESMFKPGMSWDNHGVTGWHIDHIEPLSRFNLSDREQFEAVCSIKNLQPLWYWENLAKREYKRPRVPDTPRG